MIIIKQILSLATRLITLEQQMNRVETELGIKAEPTPSLSHQPQRKLHKPHKKHVFPKLCNVCQKSFKGALGLGVHQAMVHDIHPYTNPKAFRTGTVQCPECSKFFKNEGGLHMHLTKTHKIHWQTPHARPLNSMGLLG